jgi:hypothetical protein
MARLSDLLPKAIIVPVHLRTSIAVVQTVNPGLQLETLHLLKLD